MSLLTPFIGYVSDRSYPLISLEVWLILAGIFLISFVMALIRLSGRWTLYAIMVAAVLTFALDYQFEWMDEANKYIVLSVFGATFALMWYFEKAFVLAVSMFLCVFVATTIVRAALAEESRIHVSRDHLATCQVSPPRLIHLILDEHLGIEGIPTDTEYGRSLKLKIKQFYQHYGFELFGGAYSRYFDTYDSIPNLVNFSLESLDQALVIGNRPPYSLRQNRYFQYLEQQGYQLHVVDGDYLDFCSSKETPLKHCTKYHWYTWNNVASLNISTFSKTSTLLAMFLSKYGRYQRVLNQYENVVRPLLLSHGLAMPVISPESLWTRRQFYPFSVNTMAAMDAVSENILQLPGGNMLFAHLLLPHFPYVFREDCSTRAIAQSMDIMETIPQKFRTSEGRDLRYDQYLRQVECLYVKLDGLFRQMQSSGIFNDSIIIIHGDHGARLGLRDAKASEYEELTEVDYMDAFSTLFAVRIPGRSGKYDPSLYAIDELLLDALDASFGRAPDNSIPRRTPFVYLNAGPGKEEIPVELPWNPSLTATIH